jgi:hypothetical protein
MKLNPLMHLEMQRDWVQFKWGSSFKKYSLYEKSYCVDHKQVGLAVIL